MSKKAYSDSELENLWLIYRETRSPEIREEIVHIYLDLVNIVAGRLAISMPSYIEKDELISCGFFGLLDAIERYEPSRGNKFETYASLRIRGSIIDSLRSKDWLPTSLRQKIKKYEKTVAELENSLGRSAKDEEIAEKLEISLDDLAELLSKINVSTVIPLEEYMKTEVANTAQNNPFENIELEEAKQTLAKAINILPDKEKMVVTLYYYEELTLKEISLILKLSEARVSQLHTKAVIRLKGALANKTI